MLLCRKGDLLLRAVCVGGSPAPCDRAIQLFLGHLVKWLHMESGLRGTVSEGGKGSFVI